MVIVRLVRNWQWPDLMQQTPGHTGKWGDIQFTEEPVDTCDYLVILNNLEEDMESLPCPRENIWRIVQEPPTEIFKPWHLNPSYATRTFTCDPELSQPQYIRSHPMVPWHVNRDYDFLTNVSIPEKTKSLSWITTTKTVIEGHRKRMEFLHRISGKIPGLDILGTRVIHITQQGQRNKIANEQKALGFKFVEDKWAGLAPYAYSLAIENFSGPDYWTEKIADCFLAWTVPIYYGCTNLEKYFPEESFIRIDIDKPEESIRTIKQTLREDSWGKRVKALTEARDLVLKKYQFFPCIAGYIRELSGKELMHETVRSAATKTKSKGEFLNNTKARLRISAAVCTYNRAKELRHCLDSLVKQKTSKKSYEVLVIDNNSKDNTREVANEFVEKYSNFRYLFEPQQGLSHARNLAVREAAADYIAYIDDDAKAPQDWLDIAVNIIDTYKPDIFGGPSLPPDVNGMPKWFRQGYRSMRNEKFTDWIKSGLIPGCNFFIKKELLIEYGGFEPALGMKGDEIRFHEETAILMRAYNENRKVFFDYNLGVEHNVHEYAMNLAYFIFIKYQLTKDRNKLVKKTGYRSMDFLKLMDDVDNFFMDFGNALKKRDKNKYPYPENYIIQNTIPKYIPSIVEQLEYFESHHSEIPNELDLIADKIVKGKKTFQLLKKILKRKFTFFHR